jgi:hypothetical protein
MTLVRVVFGAPEVVSHGARDFAIDPRQLDAGRATAHNGKPHPLILGALV